ncbi:MAG: YbgF trimerization domain-containing protein, partial [Gallionella sp.]|nr:YbgF trimerization domain-containing protein [Gallionella sp.]
MKLRALILLGLCIAAPAQAGLFSDDEARKQIQDVEARVLKLEEQDKQQIKSIFDLQGQIEALNAEIRNLRGQNEELAHGLQEAEKREKDFYVDLDTRLRHFESAGVAATAATPTQGAPVTAGDPDDPAIQNRAIEAAYGYSKAGSYAEAIKAYEAFLQQYPASVHAGNARFWLGNAQFALNDYKAAL